MAAKSSIKKTAEAKSEIAVDTDVIKTTCFEASESKNDLTQVEQTTTGMKIVADKSCSSSEAPKREAFKVRKVFDPHTSVMVRNGFPGKLIYKNKRTGESFIWDSLGDEQEMEIQELRNAKGSSKAFFSENWFLFDDPEVIDYLGVSAYYKNALSYEEFDGLFDMNVDEMVSRIEKLSSGQKKSVAYRAAQMIEAGMIDSRQKIAALEKSLGIKLVE